MKWLLITINGGWGLRKPWPLPLLAVQLPPARLFGTQTKRIRVCFPGSTSSTGGCRYTVVDPGVTVSSTAGPFLPANIIEVVKVTPGQRVSAISNDAGTFSLSITELTD
jgi:hypothetical protein